MIKNERYRVGKKMDIPKYFFFSFRLILLS